MVNVPDMMGPAAQFAQIANPMQGVNNALGQAQQFAGIQDQHLQDISGALQNLPQLQSPMAANPGDALMGQLGMLGGVGAAQKPPGSSLPGPAPQGQYAALGAGRIGRFA